ncbi:MAG: CpaF family protein [Lachnospiraceae bacterium]|nr:CpaF family protein [Lachnospiraceae bacterium]
MRDVKEEIRYRTLERLNLSEELSDGQVLTEIEAVILEYGRENYLPLEEKCRLKQEIFHAIRGLDILEELLRDDAVTEIMVNGYRTIFYEKEGMLFLWEKEFSSEERLRDVIQKMAAGANRVVNEASPIADTRLPDGSRVNIVLPPASLDGPAVTIRKFSKVPYTMERLTQMGALSEQAREYLAEAVAGRRNIFISGGTGSGKTTFLNALSAYIPGEERVITIEDAAELQIRSIPNLVRLEVRNANTEGCSAVTVRDLIKTALRMRPSRIIVGEVRGAEALDMLQAMNTGHEGSLSTGHANSAQDMISRLETMVLQGSDIPLFAVRRQIASAIDIFVQLCRRRDGSRGVSQICENRGLYEGEIVLKPVFEYNDAADGEGRLCCLGGSEFWKEGMKSGTKDN